MYEMNPFEIAFKRGRGKRGKKHSKK